MLNPVDVDSFTKNIENDIFMFIKQFTIDTRTGIVQMYKTHKIVYIVFRLFFRRHVQFSLASSRTCVFTNIALYLAYSVDASTSVKQLSEISIQKAINCCCPLSSGFKLFPHIRVLHNVIIFKNKCIKYVSSYLLLKDGA